ncbi:fructose 1,6-bisphosphatase [Candidatus Woesearchaeota archaeon]|nr:fructose 1,6-bisphosphatase [Candidatus Woesearchaeota archaeon]
MRTTISVIKADIGSIGGHVRPSKEVMATVTEYVSKSRWIKDYRVFSIGDDIAIMMSHAEGKDSPEVHRLAWDAFTAGTKVAKEQGLYGAGQDLLKDAFSGNIKGMGPAVAELEFEERPNEPFIVFAADKTDAGAFSLPLYSSFADPMHCSGLILSPKMAKGFKFRIMDVTYTESDRDIELNAPEELYEIAALLRDNERFVVESIFSRVSGEQAASISTTRLHNIAGKYTGKDDPVMLVRVQGEFPATGEILSPFKICHYVSGFMRGSHTGPLTPVKACQGVSFFDGPPIVSAQGFCIHNGRFTDGVDLFADDSIWDEVRRKAAQKALAIREQGFSGNAMLGMNELEYTGIVETLKNIEPKFRIREDFRKEEKEMEKILKKEQEMEKLLHAK